MKYVTFSLFLISALFMSACSDDDQPGTEYNGLYELTVHQTKSDCSAPTWTEETITEPYFRLEAQSFFGAAILGWSDCPTADVESCEGSISMTSSFVLKDGVWQQYMTTSSYYNGNCDLSYRSAILEETETGISWEAVTKSGTLTVAEEDDCEPELAEQRESELDCQAMSYWEADQL